MASEGLRSPMARALALAALTLALATCVAAPAQALRVATYNVLKYPDVAVPSRQPFLRTVMAALDPDIIFCQEMNTYAGKDSFLVNVLGNVQPGQWTGQWLDVGNGEGMGAFWKTAKVSLFNFSAITTVNGPRKVLLCGVRVVGYPNSVFFRAYSMHLKAGDGGMTPQDSTTRRLECAEIRTQINTVPANTPFILVGDSNFYGAYDGGYIRLTENQTDNDGRCVDPLGLTGAWHLNSAYARFDTQCPCVSCFDPAFSGGGMDDRFDVLFTSTAMQDGAGFDMVPNSTVAFGNDGAHFDTDINGDGFNNAVGYAVATAIHNGSDHIPVYIDVQVPARVSANSMLDFGRVITDGAATQNLSVADAALPPADELNYTLAAPVGFSAPAGSFTVNAAAAAHVHAIGMNTATPGLMAGTLSVNSNAADTASKSVRLSGTVLRHADASLDSTTSITSSNLDFGSNAILHFSDLDLRVHNLSFDQLQALLILNVATISGGNGRFSIAGGFSPVVLGDTGTTLSLHFDSYGATLDSTYTAVLTLVGSDEPLPGSAVAPPLTINLSATPISGVLGTGPPSQQTLRFYPARPNPLSRATAFAFELPRAQWASLEIYDLTGRRVASLASGEQGAGRHEVSWHAVDAQGARVPGGLYFARFETLGLSRFERVVVLP